MLLGILLALAAILSYALPRLLEPIRNDRGNPLTASVDLGERRYQQSCAACHGAAGAGHLYPGAPALDGSEHAWHHSDDQIIQLLRRGGPRMPAVAARWSDEEVAAVLGYMKSWWTPEQRRIQVGTIGE